MDTIIMIAKVIAIALLSAFILGGLSVFISEVIADIKIRRKIKRRYRSGQ